ncbi:unnamed protein product [Fusarium graminearum]|uniref:Chromosome 3, complete genome n=1 Tax=Gibberella zeae (strain ATCC MYA-4620 / CBS 123657 / FGSC 9075 / NRRL 31084 / PH-1) TaxID=229533 RepID=A0A0E0SLD0_GIBZE|nr:hypothetical protein FG05_30061 [Fusarium graminearum]CEF87243.1 unnamed protein product [Fusarium graminearum]CZS84814.1 unnamed protein product [Fusarium graminearum]
MLCSCLYNTCLSSAFVPCHSPVPQSEYPMRDRPSPSRVRQTEWTNKGGELEDCLSESAGSHNKTKYEEEQCILIAIQ